MKILVIDDCFVNVARELDGEGRIPNNSEDVHVEGTPLQSSAEASEFADALIKSMAEDRTAQDNWDPRARGRKRDRVLAARDGGAPERDLWALIMSDENYFGRYGFDPTQSHRDDPDIFKRVHDAYARMQNDALNALLFSSMNHAPGYRPITETYRNAGGTVASELVVLGEPKLGINSNHLFRNPRGEELAAANFDQERALQLVKDAGADVVLLDIKFPTADDEEYGGVPFGALLAREGVGFAFWTHEYGHSKEGILNASDLIGQQTLDGLERVYEAEWYTRYGIFTSPRLHIARKPLRASHLLEDTEGLDLFLSQMRSGFTGWRPLPEKYIWEKERRYAHREEIPIRA